MQCKNHPDRPAVISCTKMGIGYCDECLETCQACTQPAGHCKHRTACVIWEQCRKHPDVRARRDRA